MSDIEAAESRLVEALNDVHRLGHDNAGGILNNVIILAHRLEYDDDGYQVVSNLMTELGDGMPLSTRLGMLEHASTITRHQITADM